DPARPDALRRLLGGLGLLALLGQLLERDEVAVEQQDLVSVLEPGARPEVQAQHALAGRRLHDAAVAAAAVRIRGTRVRLESRGVHPYTARRWATSTRS